MWCQLCVCSEASCVAYLPFSCVCACVCVCLGVCAYMSPRTSHAKNFESAELGFLLILKSFFGKYIWSWLGRHLSPSVMTDSRLERWHMRVTVTSIYPYLLKRVDLRVSIFLCISLGMYISVLSVYGHECRCTLNYSKSPFSSKFAILKKAILLLLARLLVKKYHHQVIIIIYV